MSNNNGTGLYDSNTLAGVRWADRWPKDCDHALRIELDAERRYQDYVADRARTEPPDSDDNPYGVTRLADVEEERVAWAWPNRLPFAKVTIFDGDPDLGKSTLTLDLAGRFTTGAALPINRAGIAPMNVLIISAEDDVSDTIKGRLRAAGADMMKVFHLDLLRRDEAGKVIPFSVPEDIPRLRGALEQTGAKFVVIDPVVAFLSERIHSHNDASVRQAMQPLSALAQETGAAILLLRHLNKDQGTTRAMYRGGGSIAFVGAARAAWVVAKDLEDPSLRVLAQTKGNLSRGKAPSLTYRVESWPEDPDQPHIKWIGHSELTADQLLVPPDSRTNAPERKEAEDFWRSALADGPVLSKEIYAAAKDADITTITMKRAREGAGVLKCPERSQGKRFGAWWSYMPGQEDRLPPECVVPGVLPTNRDPLVKPQ